MIFAVATSLDPAVARVLYISTRKNSFCSFVRMPVYCIAYGCDNDQRNASLGVSFHRLPLKKPSLLKQVNNVSMC